MRSDIKQLRDTIHKQERRSVLTVTPTPIQPGTISYEISPNLKSGFLFGGFSPEDTILKKVQSKKGERKGK
jgi:hypothetical protein